jgi:hypothetical protein
MKTLTTLILFFSFTLLKAQTNPATPNANFESWTHVAANGGYDDPNGWNCLNPITAPTLGFVTCYKDSTTKISGKYSMLLVTMYYKAFSELVPGTATTGTINPIQQTIDGGIPYQLRPDSMIGWYQYTPVSGDNGDIEFYVFGANHKDTIGQAFFKTPTKSVSSWTRFSLPVIYSNQSTPDTALWIITSSDNQNSGHAGSKLIVDSLGLVFNTKTGVTNIANTINVTISPNPTSGLITINNHSNITSAVFSLYDVTGRKLTEQKIAEGANYIELTGVPAGLYIYSVQDENSTVTKTGKIVVQP